MKDNIYWLWLSLSVTPGKETFRKLIERFETAEAIFAADEFDIKRCVGEKSKDLPALLDKNLKRAEEIYSFCEKKNVGILKYSDSEFPNSLREINTPPVLLYYRGVLPDFNSECLVAMVGTRRLTDYGRKNAFIIGHDLATAGAVIVSGMAIGIDGVSHAGSISAGGVNVAFLGSGIDVCYPEQHKRLAREIVKNGCVMTEYAPGTRPARYNFPTRNRLIAGISSSTVVIEGRERSGAIITARYAKKFSKTVYALPGNVDNKNSEVTNLLIKNGAKLITTPDDIISDLEFVYTGKINPFKLKEKLDVRMSDVFLELEVSCVAQGDNIFSSYSPKKRAKNENTENQESDNSSEKNIPNETVIPEISIENMNFDKDTVELYKSIPQGEACSIESLTDLGYKMPFVMKALLKLEMGRFVTMLPGEKVKRN